MSPKTAKELMAAVTASLEQRTGRDLDAWVALVQRSGLDPLDQKAVRRWLEDEHGVLQNSRWAIADAVARAAGWERPTVESYVDGQYEGDRTVLRPIFDRLRELLEGLGDDVMMEGRTTYVPFVRGRQFAAVAAATRNRVDVGLRYADPPASERLTAGRAPGQGSHRLSLASVDEIDDEVERLLRTAYEQNG